MPTHHRTGHQLQTDFAAARPSWAPGDVATPFCTKRARGLQQNARRSPGIAWTPANTRPTAQPLTDVPVLQSTQDFHSCVLTMGAFVRLSPLRVDPSLLAAFTDCPQSNSLETFGAAPEPWGDGPSVQALCSRRRHGTRRHTYKRSGSSRTPKP